MRDHPEQKNEAGYWSAEDVLALGRAYQEAAVLGAAAELELFDPLSVRSLTAAELAETLQADRRGVAVLLDALASLRLLSKTGDRYSLAPGVAPLLRAESPESVLAMAQHQANCLRRWGQLAKVVKSGSAAERIPSVRGEEGDLESFIGAMHNISWPVAAEVIKAVQPLAFKHLLDIGGASGTWTMAFLEACPKARATLFDLPGVIPMAEKRLSKAGYGARVSLAAGDFTVDVLPGGVDLAWVSAIVHQNSREQNRDLFARVFHALAPGGRIAIRDIVMDDTRTQPAAGALFAVNMLVATEGGGTFTFDELREDLQSAGFTRAELTRRDEAMHSVVVAHKPG